MAKRKASGAIITADSLPIPPPPLSTNNGPSKRTPSKRGSATSKTIMNPDISHDVIDGKAALRASPDAEAGKAAINGRVAFESPLSDRTPEPDEPPPKKRQSGKKQTTSVPESNGNGVKKSRKKQEIKSEEEPDDTLPSSAVPTPTKKLAEQNDPEDGDEDLEDADPEELKQAVARPPPVNSDYLPLPWKGRLGYACLNTYLRNSNPPVFCSRTTRIASILDHRHPLKDESQPEHPTKNRPDKDKPAEEWRGQKFVEQLVIANIRDLPKMLRWNERYGIKFLRLSSEMCPFASHAEYGYKLASFASEEFAAVGKVIAELGHRVTMHPGQFTQLGSPRPQVIDASFRDLEYHDELLSLLKLPEQQDRDAVMILHMGGMFGDKEATLQRFRENYAKLSDSVKRRLVLENDDMCWGVHDLLPICQELNIPFVLDWHHHNIIFDEEKIREGSADLVPLLPTIIETWTRKGITPKMHYSEPRPAAITRQQRRAHKPRVVTLPPCPADMDLMIEAKDKEQAVFELMRTFKLPGWDSFNDVIPFVRTDDNKLLDADLRKKEAAAQRKKVKAAKNGEDADGIVAEEAEGPDRISDADVGMGGPDGRVYWPPGMEEWLRPQKRVVKKKEAMTEQEKSFARTPAGKRKAAEEKAAAEKASSADGTAEEEDDEEDIVTPPPKKAARKTASAKSTPAKRARVKKEATPTTEDEEAEDAEAAKPNGAVNGVKRKSARSNRAPKTSYVVDEPMSDA